MQDFDSAVDQLVTLVRTTSDGQAPSELKAAFAGFLGSADPNSLPPEWGNGRDVIGEAYMRLLSPEHRRASGQVFTPSWAARVMAGWAITDQRKLLLDPGCGSGVILQTAASIAGTRRLQLHGFDIDPVALEMTRVNCAIRDMAVITNEIDFLRDEVALRPDCIVANPPYTRHHELDRDTKDEIHSGLGSRLGLKYTRQASLHALFLARAIEIATDGARLAFITPSQWLSTKYGREIREYVESLARIDAILELPCDFFPNARTSASITLFTKGELAGPVRTRSLGQVLPPVEDVLAWLKEPYVPQSAPQRDHETMVQLSELASVGRGVATGHNAFFVLSESERVRRGIPAESVRRCISSPRVFSGEVLTEDIFESMPDSTSRWLLCVDAADLDPAVNEYVEHGEELGVDERYLASHRSIWYQLKCRERYPILFSYLNKERPHVVLNETDAVPLNTWLVIEPREGVDPGRLAHALASDVVANSARNQSRHYGHGLWKLEPSEVRQLLVPWGDK